MLRGAPRPEQPKARVTRCGPMRYLALIFIFAAISNPAMAATPSWLEGFLPTQHARPVHKARPVPAAKPAAAKPATAEVVAPKPADPVAPLPRPRPEQRAPEPVPAAPAAKPATETAPAAPAGASPQPAAEGESTTPAPPRVFQTACPAVITGQVQAKALPPINDGQCHEQSPMAVTGVLVNGRMVEVKGGVTLNCEMASSLPGWASQVDGYLFSKQNARVKSINVGTSYMCRDRNTGTANNTLSEHGFADAVDVTGFTLDDGRTVNVSTGWPQADQPDGRFLRYAHDAACSMFTTTLGPEANALHHDHFHLDLGCHGKTCTARMCE
jgi:hypothetical protein